MRPRHVIENVRGLLSPMAHTPHAQRMQTGFLTPRNMQVEPLCTSWKCCVLVAMGFFLISTTQQILAFPSRASVSFCFARGMEKKYHTCNLRTRRMVHLVFKWRTLQDALKEWIRRRVNMLNFLKSACAFIDCLARANTGSTYPRNFTEALGGSLDTGGGKTGFLRRLDWHKPSCTLVTSPTMPATICMSPCRG